MITNKQKNKLLDALNRMDELACGACQGSNDVEIELDHDYNLIFDFILNTKTNVKKQLPKRKKSK